ncbi:MAG: VWA domain-containing protein [Myxococcales bacterium]|nr:VWA domain-containing protein [Myxococcales bacterium]
MKVKSVAGLAAVGMFLTSLSVWSVTKPSTGPDAITDVGNNDLTTNKDPNAADHPGAAFTTGKTLMMEGRLGHGKLLSTKDNATMLLVNVSADNNSAAPTATPLNLSIVVDRSGSMKGRRLQNAIDGARGMVRRLRDGDTVSVVSYNHAAEVLVAPTTVDSFSRDRVSASLASITAQGDTCISCGIDEAMAQLRQRSGMIDRILLLSDGEATAGVRDVEGFRSIGARIRNMGASISSVGVDVDYNERVMNALAVESNGRHHFVANAADLPRVFDQELDTLVKSLAKNAEVAIELAPGVDVDRVFDRTFRREGRKLLIPLGGFSAGEEKTLLVSLRVPRGAAGERPIADVRMTYDDLSGGNALGQRGDCQGKLSALLTENAAEVSDLDSFVSARMLRSQTAAALTEANELFANGRSDEARRKLGARLDDLKQQRAATLARAPSPAKAKLEADFDKQSSALGQANDGFASPPAAAPAEAERKGREQVKENATKALDLGF